MTAALSVVLPVWNEESVIGALVADLEREVADLLDSTEIIVVDDGSTDGTWAALERLARADGRIHVWRREENRGHGPSVIEGLERARGDWIFQLDSDGQFVVREFWELWRRRERADLVLGVRARRRDPRHRIVLSRVVSVVSSALAGRRLRDPNVPFRMLRRAVWDDLRPFLDRDALAPSILLAVGAAVRGWRIDEVPVSHLPRAGGGSSLRAWRLLRFSLCGLGELLRFRFALARAGGRGGR